MSSSSFPSQKAVEEASCGADTGPEPPSSSWQLSCAQYLSRVRLPTRLLHWFLACEAALIDSHDLPSSPSLPPFPSKPSLFRLPFYRLLPNNTRAFRYLAFLAALLLLALLSLSLPSSSSLLPALKPRYSSLLFHLPWPRQSPPPSQGLTLTHLIPPPRTAHQYQQYLRQHSPDLAPSLWQRGDSGLSPDWQQRLNPVRVEALEGYVGLVVHTATLTGAAHQPPLFNALPCIAANQSDVTANLTAFFPQGQCEYAELTPGPEGGFSIVVTVHEGAQGDVIRKEIHPAPLSPEQLQRLADPQPKREALQSYLRRCPEIAQATGGGEPDLQREGDSDGDSDAGASPCPLSVAAELVSALVAPVTHRLWVDGLQSERVYSFSVQLFNGSHLTAPFHSPRVAVQSQLVLYEREQRRVTRYLNHLASAHSSSSSFHSHSLSPVYRDDSDADDLRDLDQPTASAALPPPVEPSPSRSVAPFEAALVSDADSLCPAAFHAQVAQYRRWHAAQVARLLAVRDDPAALRALLTTDADPLRLLVSQAWPRSGVSDRTHGLLGAYTTGLLTRRVLLMADDWPDIALSMQPSLQLRASLIAPHLNHSLLADLSQAVPMSMDGLAVDDLDAAYPTPVAWVTSIRGMQVKFLTASQRHGPTLRAWGLLPETIVGCVYHSLWQLRLSTMVSHQGYASPLAALLQPSNVGVGIQIRTWDDGAFDMSHNQNGQPHTRAAARGDGDNSSAAVLAHMGVHGYFHCAQDVSDAVRERAVQEGRTLRPLWLLMADDVAVRRAAVARWGGGAAPRLLTLEAPALLGHSSLGEAARTLQFQQHALVEQLLFALCQHHIVSGYSGFGRLPAVLGMRGRPVFGMDYREEVRQRAVCMDEKTQGMDIMALATQNSWL